MYLTTSDDNWLRLISEERNESLEDRNLETISILFSFEQRGAIWPNILPEEDLEYSRLVVEQ